MPLSFSNIKNKVKSNAIPLMLSAFPGTQAVAPLYNAATNALRNKTAPISTPLQPTTQKPVTQPVTQTTQRSNGSNSTLTLQKQLNQKNAGKPGWTPLVEDGILGPKTQAAQSWQPSLGNGASTYTPPGQQQGQQTAGVGARTQEQNPTFGGILMDLLKKATQSGEGVAEARNNLTKFQTGLADKVADIRSDDIPLEFQQGRAQVVQQAGAEKEAALQTGVSNALAEQQQQLGALGTAAGLAQPVQVPYSNQYLDPQTGLPIGGGTTGGGLMNSVAQIAEKVRNGTMGYDAGVQALSGYGQAGVNTLQQFLGSQFNVQQSNATADAQEASTLQTGTVGGQLQKGAETVKAHMRTLQQAYDSMTNQFGIPAANAVANWFRQQTGNPKFQSYNIALQNVRDELAKILGGGSSTDSSRATAHTLLPDNMSPAQLKAAIKTATELMNSKIAEYTRAPQFNSNQSTGGSGSSIWNW